MERERPRDTDKTMEMDKDRKKTWGGGDTLTETIIISRWLDNLSPQMRGNKCQSQHIQACHYTVSRARALWHHTTQLGVVVSSIHQNVLDKAAWHFSKSLTFCWTTLLPSFAVLRHQDSCQRRVSKSIAWQCNIRGCSNKCCWSVVSQLVLRSFNLR